MGGDVVEVYALVGAACSEDDFLSLFWDGGGGG